MSSITEIKQKATKQVTILKKKIDIFKQMIQRIREHQDILDVCVEEDVLTDGEYLRVSNLNLKEMAKYHKDMRNAIDELMIQDQLKKHGHYAKIEFSDSDSD
jgi:hypothetical protein